MAALKLPDIAPKVLRAHVMVHAVVTALEAGPVRLHAVRVGHAPYVLAHIVLDRFVRPRHPPIGPGIVGVDHRVRLGVALHKPLERRRVRCVDNLAGNLASVAVLHADHRRLPNGTAPSMEPLGLMLVGFLAADVGLVHLDRPVELTAGRIEGLADAVRHVPGGLLRDPQVAV